MNQITTGSTRRSSFALWLRRGVRVPAQLADPALELKYNHNHDPTNGQFTFADGASAGAARDSRPDGRAGTGPAPNDPKHARNHGIYIVKRGDTLHHIAATRVGLKPSDLAWLNDLKSDELVIGQQIKLPHQAYLDRGKHAFDTTVALDAYVRTHAGRLPPDAAHPPSLAEQSYGPGTTHVEKNGYAYDIDPQGRTRDVSGLIHFNRSQVRSSTAQRDVGGKLPTDHGGHYIARRFDGPTEAFNHFAQDAKFNQSSYRKLENRWAAATARGEKTHVTIHSIYIGKSPRPSSLTVTWSIGGKRRFREFPNRRTK